MSNSSVSQHRITYLFILLLVTPSAIFVIWRILWGIYSTPFWMDLLLIALFFASVASIVGSCAFLFSEVRKNIILAFLPIILNVFMVFAITNFDLEAPLRNWDFRRNLKAREEVVEMVMSGKLRLRKWGRVNLPEKYKHLSQWGTQGTVFVSEEADSVFFATSDYYFFLESDWSGFVYTSKKNPSERDLYYVSDKDAEHIKMKDHWTWIEKED